jgi:hypothetical protein
VNGFYWERHPDGPFATLIAVAATYCHTEQSAGAYESLRCLAKREDDQEMRAFKAELQQALADPSLRRMTNFSRRWHTATEATRSSSAACGVTCMAVSPAAKRATEGTDPRE